MSSSSVRVGIVMPLGEQRGGGELMLLHLLQAGRGQGIEWIVYYLEDGPMVATTRKLGVTAHVVLRGKMRDVLNVVATGRRLADMVRQEKVRLMLNWMGTGQLYGGLAAQFARIPALWYQLGIPGGRAVIDRLATRIPSQAIITLSKAGYEAQQAIPPHRPLHLIYPAVELDRFDPTGLPTPDEARRKLGLPLEGPLIGTVGRLQRWKGGHTLPAALPRVLESYPNAHVVIVGGEHPFEPEYPAFLKDTIAKHGVADRVILPGLQKNVPEWMQAFDIFVHASSNEPFGIVIIEAMALGKPVIATDQGGPTEIITPGKDGLLTPFEDADALAKAVLRYLDEPELREQVGKAAQERAQDFSTEQYARKIIASCQEALQATG